MCSVQQVAALVSSRCDLWCAQTLLQVACWSFKEFAYVLAGPCGSTTMHDSNFVSQGGCNAYWSMTLLMQCIHVLAQGWCYACPQQQEICWDHCSKQHDLDAVLPRHCGRWTQLCDSLAKHQSLPCFMCPAVGSVKRFAFSSLVHSKFSGNCSRISWTVWDMHMLRTLSITSINGVASKQDQLQNMVQRCWKCCTD